MNPTTTNCRQVICPNCLNPMKWDSFTLAHRPDVLRGRDERAPIDWAWHCRCGKWVYHERRPPR